MIKAVSLFSNVGIGETYLKDAGVDICVANELIKNRSEFYKHLYPECNMICGDITNKEVFEEILKNAKENNAELLLATPPCQGMSTAGKMAENDVRNFLVMYAIEFAKKLAPKYILFENVPQQKNTKLLYKGELMLITDIVQAELGNKYNIKCDILNAADYGVAQNRKRLIFLMTRKDLDFEWNFPEKEKKIVTVRDVIGDLPSFEAIPLDEKLKITESSFYQNKYIYDKNINKWHKPMVIANRYIECMLRTPTGKTAFDNEVYYPKKLNGEKMKGFKNTFKRIEWDMPAPTVTMQNGNIGSQENGHPGRKIKDGVYSDARVLSILEIMRIMSLPDDWNIPDWATDTLIRSVIGEGIPPVLLKKIVLQLVRSDEDAKK